MKEKLIIRNFGPIKDVELDLGRFNILIGEQATGKSTVAKVLAVCRYFSYIVHGNSYSIVDGLIPWGLFDYLKLDSYIFYQCYHYEVTIKQEKAVIESEELGSTIYSRDFPAKVIPLSSEFKNLLAELEKIKPVTTIKNLPPLNDSIDWRIPTSFFLNDVKNVMDNPFYLPTQRGLQSIFDIGKNSIQNLSSALFNQLSKMDGIARLYKQETYIEPLDIYYVNRNGHGFIRKANETEFYSLYNAASGYQSMIPIVLVIKYYTELKKKAKTFLIEEPEQNLFPSAQNKLMQYLVEKTVNFGNSVLLTTQSPYTLTSVNNLMYAYQVGQIHSEKTSREIDKKYWLNPSEVSAYMMKPDGSCEDIFDREEGMIKSEKIDSASDIINDVFDKLINIEIAG